MSQSAVTTQVKLPNLGENIESGDVVAVLVDVGDMVELEQGIVELETDKATVEVPSTAAGRVVEIHVKEGDSIQVGGLILTVEDATNATSPAADAAAAAPSRPEPPAATAPHHLLQHLRFRRPRRPPFPRRRPHRLPPQQFRLPGGVSPAMVPKSWVSYLLGLPCGAWPVKWRLTWRRLRAAASSVESPGMTYIALRNNAVPCLPPHPRTRTL